MLGLDSVTSSVASLVDMRPLHGQHASKRRCIQIRRSVTLPSLIRRSRMCSTHMLTYIGKVAMASHSETLTLSSSKASNHAWTLAQ